MHKVLSKHNKFFSLSFSPSLFFMFIFIIKTEGAIFAYFLVLNFTSN